MNSSAARVLVVWLPDWPIIAARRNLELPVDQPLALIHKGVVFACSSDARASGVQRGLAVREAQLRCPQLLVVAYDPQTDARAFEPVVASLEELVPGVRILRPGLCAIRARGPARFYGGEERAASTIHEAMAKADIAARLGIADSVFGAERAALKTSDSAPVSIVEPGTTRQFLASAPISTLDDSTLVPVLRRLGLHSLGDFAALDQVAVGARFGEAGLRAHARASATDRLSGAEHTPEADFGADVAFEPALDRVDQIAFGVRTASESMIDRLAEGGLVCTALRITVTSESGERRERSWSHPHHFSAADVVDRVRWQLQGSGGAAAGPASPVERIELSPARVDASANHESGLWGTSLDERVHHALARLHSVLGHGAVSTPTLGGGRFLSERQVLVAWGDETPPSKRTLPWPGSIPPPAPATVFAEPRPADVRGSLGEPIDVDARGTTNSTPAWLSLDRSPALKISSWAGPWSVTQRWWDSETRRSAHRFQMIDSEGMAWLMILEDHEWAAEARYD
ncbi:protein ImuB [Agreia bicolorata]|uniref:Protein ImuB n=1 Tax=Agreia bicolorata TaxID=110935 RepID=A0A1T4YMF5_9MICO|nr:DNA polymerase Y family protein [Agreia bicolorata]SKB02979.1 protein ImuB [Agreia bicolorata]